MTFIDDHSRKVFLFPMTRKNQVFDIFCDFKNFVEKQRGRSIKTIRTDNGGEYVNHQFKSFMTKHRIHHQLTVPDIPQQNGIADHMNRTIMEKVRCMLLLIDAELDNRFWAEAATTAVCLINRIPCRGMKHVTPEEMWSGTKPDLSELRVFGCKAMSHIPKHKRKKLGSKSTECIMVGYSEQSKAYRLYNPTTKKVFVSRDVVFIEPELSQVISSEIRMIQFSRQR